MTTYAAHAAHQCHEQYPRRTSRAPGLSTFELLLLAAGVLLLIAAAVVPTITAASGQPAQVRTIRVDQEDSLWRLAESHPVAGLSTAQTVRVIREINDLESSSLAIGQLLLVPQDAGPAMAELGR